MKRLSAYNSRENQSDVFQPKTCYIPEKTRFRYPIVQSGWLIWNRSAGFIAGWIRFDNVRQQICPDRQRERLWVTLKSSLGRFCLVSVKNEPIDNYREHQKSWKKNRTRTDFYYRELGLSFLKRSKISTVAEDWTRDLLGVKQTS